MTKPHAFQRRDIHTCSTCFDFGSNKGFRFCRRNQRVIRWNPWQFGCGDYGTSDVVQSPVPVITEAMILSDDGWMGSVPTCFQCKHRTVGNEMREPRDQPDGSGTIIEDVIQPLKRACNRNPLGRQLYGDTCQHCGMFELNTNRWHDLKIQSHEWERRIRSFKTKGGQTTLEVWT